MSNNFLGRHQIVRKLRYIFLGATKYSEELLKFLIKNDFYPLAIFAIEQEFIISYDKGKTKIKMKNYNYANLKIIAKELGIPYFVVGSDKGEKIRDYKDIIRNFNLDLILVLGWYYIVPRDIRDLAKMGTWGIHASLLPKYAGGSPLVWAIINGEKKTGVTLFRLDDDMDAGDIIYQESFPILFKDTINDVYLKAIKASKKILLKALRNIDNIIFIPQDKSKIEYYPSRKPEDGLINWNDSVIKIYNFIRAQTIPYPCAFSFLNQTKIKIISSKVTKIKSTNFKPGTIVNIKDRMLVATNDYFLELLEILVDYEKKYNFSDFAKNKRLIGAIFGS